MLKVLKVTPTNAPLRQGYGCDWCGELIHEAYLLITFCHVFEDMVWVEGYVTKWDEPWHTHCWVRWAKTHSKEVEEP